MYSGDKSTKYRRYARECLEMAAASEDGEIRTTFLLMAQSWFRLARADEETGSRPEAERVKSRS
jgi:hypothetical protein